MRNKILLMAGSALVATSLQAGVCSDELKVHFTFFGGTDRDYIVTQNTFKNITSEFPSDKLEGASVTVDLLSLDTSADMNNQDKTWPAAMAKTRENNVKNQLFKNFEANGETATAKVASISDDAINIEFTMNGVTKEIPFSYEVDGETLKAKGKIDILDYNTQNGWEKFERVCSRAFHHGASYSDLEVFFEVPASCK